MEIEILDGRNVIGGNKILITSDDKSSLLLDFGKNFKVWGGYFEEFLQPRTGAGIFDLWKLGLVPKFSNIYRLVPSELSDEVQKERSINLEGLILTHAHLDHAGLIPVLSGNIPITSTGITYKILKAIQDTGQSSFFSEYCTASEVEVINSAHRETKFQKKRDSTNERIFRFEASGNISSIKYRLFPVDHSIPGAVSVYLEVDGVKIAYTGDLRFHGENGNKTEEFFRFIKEQGVDVLITEGTRVPEITNIEESLKSIQYRESDVKSAVCEVVKSSKGSLVVADFGARNVERLKVFFEIAKETGRKLAITMKDAYLLHLLKSEGFDFIDNENIVIVESKREQKREWVKKIAESYEKKIVRIKEIGDNPGDYIVCYSFWDLPNLLDIDIKSGAYIYSTSEAFTEEQVIDTRRLLNWLEYLHLTPYGVKEEGEKIAFTYNYHASGHTSFGDLVAHIEYAKPDTLVPIHTEHLETFETYFKDRLRILNSQNGNLQF